MWKLPLCHHLHSFFFRIKRLMSWGKHTVVGLKDCGHYNPLMTLSRSKSRLMSSMKGESSLWLFVFTCMFVCACLSVYVLFFWCRWWWVMIMIINYILVEVPWYIGVNPWLWVKGLRVRFPSMPGTFVLRQDTLSTLLLSTQVYINGYPVRCERYLRLMWHVCAPKVAPGQNAPQGVEKVHY